MINNEFCPICDYKLQDVSITDVKSNQKKVMFKCINCECFQLQQGRVVINGITYLFSDYNEIRLKIRENKLLYQELVGKLGIAEQKINHLEKTVQQQEVNNNGLEFWNQMQQQEIDLLNESLKNLKKDE